MRNQKIRSFRKTLRELAERVDVWDVSFQNAKQRCKLSLGSYIKALTDNTVGNRLRKNARTNLNAPPMKILSTRG
jgi:hypothetical protein